MWEFDCLHFTQYMSMSPHGTSYKQTWYPGVRYWWETFIKVLLSNITNYGESDVQ